jgi:hypothetical protein
MGIKLRDNNISSKRQDIITKMAEDLADKPYGSFEVKKIDNSQVRTTITLQKDVLYVLEDIAMHNKRDGKNLRSVSAIIRDCLEQYLKN